MTIYSTRAEQRNQAKPISQIDMANLKELIKCSDDPHYFIENYLQLQTPQGKRKFTLYAHQDFQISSLECSIVQTSIAIPIISAQCRQSGATTLGCAYFLWQAMFKPNQSIVLATINQALAKEMRHMIGTWIAELPIWMKPKIKRYSAAALQFENDSELLFGTITNGNGLRGRSLSGAFVDNLAHTSDKAQEDFICALMPALSPMSKLFIAGTPSGNTNVFAKLYNDPRFENMKITAEEVFSPLTCSLLRANMSAVDFAREYECDFTA